MFLDSNKIVSDFDPHFKIFHDLMAFKVEEILLVSSLYDAFIMEEDGSIATRLANQYQGLNLSGAPRITWVSSASNALEIIRSRRFDMVITMPYLGSMDAYSLGIEIKKIQPGLPVILITHNLRATHPMPEVYERRGIDNIFLWDFQSDMLVAIIKNVEDHVNVDADTVRAMVRVIIYVEDSPVYRSVFLPLLYKEVFRQTQSVLDESINEKHRLLRMRARPKILMATDYEEAMALYEAYKPFVFGVISDARFPRNGEMDSQAGIRFLSKVREEITDLPLLMISTESVNKESAEQVPAIFIDKESPDVAAQFHEFFLRYLGFGDFVFKMPDETVICHAKSIHEFEEKLKIIPEESLIFHAQRNHFSNWVMARSEVALARRLHRDFLVDIGDPAVMREDLVFKVHALRKLRQQGVVAKFYPESYDSEIMDFVKIGEGSIGGKARGVAFMWAQFQKAAVEGTVLAEVTVKIPKTCVVTADGFNGFIAENGLEYQKGMSDDEIADMFLAATLPEWFRKDLSGFLHKFKRPLSVRSSSLLEDAQFKPYAGLYSTYFLTNSHPDFAERLFQLESAVKLVYASTWFESPRAFSKTAGQGRDDAMAIILQEIVGTNYDDYWYPAISGVGQSHNYYPVMNMQAHEGIAHIALGVGKTVVEGEKSLRFSPSHPKKLIQFSTVDDILANCQREFYALDLSQSDCLNRQKSNLVKRAIQDAEMELPVQMLSSTYIADEYRIRDAALPGLKVMTFAQLLKYDIYPLPQILSELLSLGRKAMGCEVEIEFAVNLHQDVAKSEFYFLQMRPMVTGGEKIDVQICDHELDLAFCYSGQCLGHGRFETMADIIFVKPEGFDPAHTKRISLEIGDINRTLADTERPYLLIGPGRWGSADPWLGIPVQWREISGVGAIIETTNDLLRVDPSQGSHFFQNITSLGIPYVTVSEQAESTDTGDSTDGSGDRLDWQWLMAQEYAYDSEFLRHVVLDKPFVLKCNGKESESVMYYEPESGEKECRVQGESQG